MYFHSASAPAAQPHQASVRETRVSRAVDIRRYISLVRSPNYRIHGRPFHEFSHSCTSRRSRSFVERRVVQTTCRSTKSRVRGRVLYVCLMSRGIPRRAICSRGAHGAHSLRTRLPRLLRFCLSASFEFAHTCRLHCVCIDHFSLGRRPAHNVDV